MNEPAIPIEPQETLAAIATRFAGAARVFQRHGLDFCCRGHQTLQQACATRNLAPEALLAELRRELDPTEDGIRWDERPVGELIDHLLSTYHEAHRRELPRLVAMARKVEAVHADRADRPSGLAAHLEFCADELERHMQKEEQVLFPMLRAGHGGHASGPIQVMEHEHQEHGANLEALRRLAHDYVPPHAACATWRALYLGLEQLERDLMQHIHLENHVLFPRVLAR
ncbi:MAG: iron-sulfur cluster repair protein YtfE [Planctomycetota bacterium]